MENTLQNRAFEMTKKNVAVYCEPELAKKLASLAEKRGLSLSSLAREVILQALE